MCIATPFCVFGSTLQQGLKVVVLSLLTSWERCFATTATNNYRIGEDMTTEQDIQLLKEQKKKELQKELNRVVEAPEFLRAAKKLEVLANQGTEVLYAIMSKDRRLLKKYGISEDVSPQLMQQAARDVIRLASDGVKLQMEMQKHALEVLAKREKIISDILKSENDLEDQIKEAQERLEELNQASDGTFGEVHQFPRVHFSASSD